MRLTKVAIKIIEKQKIEEMNCSTTIQKEIEILKSLDHESIIKVYEIIENSLFVYIVMEYSGGGELYNYIVQKRRLDENEAGLFYIQLLNAIEYLHERKIVHRYYSN